MSRTPPPMSIAVVGTCLVIMVAGWFAMAERGPLSADAQIIENGQIVTELTEPWDDGFLVLIHRCIGSVETHLLPSGQTQPFCLGQSRLMLERPDGTEATLADTDTTDPTQTPLLLDAHLLGSGTLLIAYAPDACLTAGECGNAELENRFTMAADVSTGTTRTLVSFPSFGTPIWNDAEARAIFLPHTCEHGTCTSGPLIGYDLATDTAHDLTTDTAAAKPNVTDASGKIQPTWTDVAWDSDTVVRATIVYPNGMRKDVRVDF